MLQLTHQSVRIFLLAFTLLIFTTISCGQTTVPKQVGVVDSEGEVEEETTVSSENTVDSSAPDTFEIGDIISIGDTVLVVLGWEDLAGGEYTQPEAGKKLIAVEVLVVNQGSFPASISSLFQMTIKDNLSQVYDVDITANFVKDSKGIDGELAPGERVRGKVGFQVPVDPQELLFVFDAKLFGKGKVFVNLGETPISIETPAVLDGETDLLTHNIGDSVEIGTLIITVNDITSSAGNDFYKPKPGNDFIIVNLTLENTSAESVNIAVLLQASMKDATGQSYGVDIFVPSESAPGGEFAPGEQKRGEIGFQVPLDADELVFIFDAAVFGAGKVFITVP